VREFYGLHFRNEEEVARFIRGGKPSIQKIAAVAKMLRKQNGLLGSPKPVIENIESLASGESSCVVTGQQVGILTGPLYTIYKAVTAIKLAGNLSEKSGVKVVPVFWMASNDHDFEEIRSISVLDSDGEFRTFSYTPENSINEKPVGKIVLEDLFDNVIRKLDEILPDSGFKESALNLIRETYKTGSTLGVCFGRLMVELFGRYGLVLMDASDPAVMEYAFPILEKEISNPLASTKAAGKAAGRLAGKGYSPQVGKVPHRTGIFLETELGMRKAVSYKDGRFHTDGSNENYSAGEMISILREHPGRFSPNVLLRPIVQDYLLPTAAYVGGPAEIAYYAQLGGIYGIFENRQPPIFPRASVTLAGSSAMKLLNGLGITIRDLSAGADEVFSGYIRTNMEGDIERLVESPAQKVDSVLGDISKELADYDPGLRDATEPVRRRILQQIDGLKKKIIKSGKQKQQALREKITETHEELFPGGKSQERALNIFSFLSRHGMELIDKIYSATDIFSDEHQVIEI
jgi:bacillithiol biosynthesis cysteine-adding enzyme BshC